MSEFYIYLSKNLGHKGRIMPAIDWTWWVSEYLRPL